MVKFLRIGIGCFKCYAQRLLVLVAFWIAFAVSPLALSHAAQVDTSNSASKHNLVLGVYAYQNEDAVRKQFQDLAEYLSQAVTDTTISLEVMNASALIEAVHQKRVDLLLPNPALYELIRNEGQLGGVLATLERVNPKGVVTSELGGVIFSLTANPKIQQLEDLKNSKIAIPTVTNTGAFGIPMYELIELGYNANDFTFMQMGDNDSVISAVLDGKAQIGFVRTGILENWFEQKGLNPKLIRVLHPQTITGFPYLVSTRLYPEWPFVVTTGVDAQVVRQISVALYSLDANHPAAIAAGISGFIPPKDYLPLEALLRELRLPPYDVIPQFSLAEAIKSHPGIFFLGLAMILVLALGFIVSNALRLRVKEKTQRFDDLLFATNAMTWEWNVLTGEIEINHSWASSLGYQLDELQPLRAEHWWQMLNPEDVPRVKEVLDAHLNQTLQVYEAEFRMRHKEGHWVWMMARGRVIKRDLMGNPIRMTGIHIDIGDLKQKELRLEFNARRDKVLLELPVAADSMQETEFMQYAQELTEKLTESQISFVHFLNADETIELVAWSKRTLEEYCDVPDKEMHYPLQKAGIWADAAREFRPVVVNDYNAYPNKRGLPLGHAPLERLISVPVIEDGQVVMLTGVGNKQQDYTTNDVETVQLISNEIWRLVQRKRGQLKIIEQTLQFQRLVNDLGPDHVVFSYDGESGKLLYVSETIADVFGVTKDSVLGTAWSQAIEWSDNSREIGQGYLNSILSGLEDYNQFDMRFYHPIDGGHRTIRVSQHAVRGLDNELISVDGLAVNITHQKEAERKLQEAARVFEYAQEGILIANKEGLIINVNAAFSRITGFKKSDVLGENPRILSSGRQSQKFYSALWAKLIETGYWYGEIWNRRKNGEIYPQKLNITTIRSEDGEIQQFIALFSDISIEKKQQEELEFIAHFDPLTGLPNRVLLTDRLNQAVVYSERHQKELAVTFIDLDGFKEVNDKYGHAAGDALLEELAKRFKSVVRKGDTVSRMGGDEFVAVFPELESKETLNCVLDRMLAEAKKPIDYQGLELQISASIGVALYDGVESSVSADLLIRHADQAMYQAKTLGKNQIAYFETANKSLFSDLTVLKQKLAEIEEALNQNQFELFYQPKLYTQDLDKLSFEALIRWRKGAELIPPFFFLPYLDGQPLGLRLGYWVIETAIQQVEAWKAEGKACSVSVNVDGYQLEQPDFVERVQAILHKYTEFSPTNLTIELLESSALDDIDCVTSVINELRQMGVRFAIDDFGTGYASLNYLKRLPVDELKIDQSFIKDIFEQPQGLVILESVISMGTAFNMQVVAEGVETQEHIDLLLKLGIKILQGYAISRPMESSKVTDWLYSESYTEKNVLTEAEGTPMQREGVAKLIAVLEFKKWAAKIHSCFEASECESLELLSPNACPFAGWMNSRALEELPKEVFEEMVARHDSLHELAQRAYYAKRDGAALEASNLFAKFVPESRAFLEYLEKHLLAV